MLPAMEFDLDTVIACGIEDKEWHWNLEVPFVTIGSQATQLMDVLAAVAWGRSGCLLI